MQITVPQPMGDIGDGTLTAVTIAPPHVMAKGSILTLAGPAGLIQGCVAGRYFLARCCAAGDRERAHGWEIYLRRPLFMVGRWPIPDAGTERWQMWVPDEPDPGYLWLQGLRAGTPVNLIGPLGNGFSIQPTTHNLLLTMDQRRTPLLLPLVDRTLDRGGRVTAVVLGGQNAVEELTKALPLAVEVRRAVDDEEWLAILAETLPWADQVCGAIAPARVLHLADQVRKRRVRLDAGFGLMLVEADLVCGTGACLACVIALANGSLTRACVHGPVFDLVDLAGKA